MGSGNLEFTFKSETIELKLKVKVKFERPQRKCTEE